MIKDIFKCGVGRMAGDERRQQLLHVAMRLFSEKGFSGTTTKEIAQNAGVSEATVFKHFANKDELYSAILDQKACDQDINDPFEKVADQVAAKDDFGVFYGMALNALEKHEHDEKFLRLMMHSALEGHDLARIFFENFVVRVYEFLGSYIRQRQADGVFREVEPRVVVRAFIGMFVHHSLNNILWDRERKLLKVSNEEAAREFATIILQGIKK
ncbi:MAG TPA: TetR/AcrR family transcriptional regulator [Pyrinomonadaceae bacterium]|nr:TetR/AcrR family transcriptional regulator [Pyrinomonadaceae bacterium]